MESLLLGSVVGAGYTLSQDGKNDRQTNVPNDVFNEPSQNSIYSSNYLENVNNREKTLGRDSFEQSRDALNTNVIPPGFNNKLVNKENNPVSYLQDSQNTEYVSELSGQTVDRDSFKSVPFFGSHIRQVTDQNSTKPIVENHTGIEEFSKKKSTPVPLFEPTKDVNIQYGTQPSSQNMLDRINPSRYRNNELPFEKINVGPGINNDFSAMPSGGFHPDMRDQIKIPTIDDLRPVSNPQISYKGRVIPGKAISGKTTQKSKLCKNRPDTYYENDSDRYFTTTGAYLKPKQTGHIIVKDTNRRISTQYSGSAGPAMVKNQSKRSLYRKSTRNNFKTDGPRNAFTKDSWRNEEFGDYGKKSLNLPSNERDITGKRNHVSNVSTIVKALVAPVLDLMKTTKKENTIGNIRETGNIGTSGVTKNVTWDPNDVAKTTIKETNIHDVRTGNMGVEEKGVAWDPNDIAKTTIKETNIHDTRTGNLIANTKGTVIDKNEMKFKTTIRETLKPEEINGNMKVSSKLTVHDPNDLTKTTLKETNIHDNRTGNLKGPVKLTVYDPNHVAKTTIKQTTIDNKHTGNVGGVEKGSGYLTNSVEAPNTNRQFTGDFEYEGIGDSEKTGLGYLTNEKQVHNTNRQFTSDYEYEGTAESMYKKPKSYDTAYAMRTNPSREKTLQGRAPTKSSTKIVNGKDKVNMEIKKIPGDVINTRELTKSKVYNSIKTLKSCSITQEKPQYDYKIMDERINPALLDAHRNNPYSQSLSSYSY